MFRTELLERSTQSDRLALTTVLPAVGPAGRDLLSLPRRPGFAGERLVGFVAGFQDWKAGVVSQSRQTMPGMRMWRGLRHLPHHPHWIEATRL